MFDLGLYSHKGMWACTVADAGENKADTAVLHAGWPQAAYEHVPVHRYGLQLKY